MSDIKWLAADEQVAWRNYLRGSARLNAQIGNDLFEVHRLTLNKYEVLVRLSESEGWTMRMSDLADDLVHSRSRLTRTVASLEEDGLVVREACSGDGRGRNCRMTRRVSISSRRWPPTTSTPCAGILSTGSAATTCSLSAGSWVGSSTRTDVLISQLGVAVLTYGIDDHSPRSPRRSGQPDGHSLRSQARLSTHPARASHG